MGRAQGCGENVAGRASTGSRRGNPLLALAQKMLERVRDAGLPADLLPAELTTIAVSAEVDAETNLRAQVLEFMDAVRAAERSVALGRGGGAVPEELDVATHGAITEDDWRAHWPVDEPAEDAGNGEAGR